MKRIIAISITAVFILSGITPQGDSCALSPQQFTSPVANEFKPENAIRFYLAGIIKAAKAAGRDERTLGRDDFYTISLYDTRITVQDMKRTGSGYELVCLANGKEYPVVITFVEDGIDVTVGVTPGRDEDRFIRIFPQNAGISISSSVMQMCSVLQTSKQFSCSGQDEDKIEAELRSVLSYSFNVCGLFRTREQAMGFFRRGDSPYSMNYAEFSEWARAENAQVLEYMFDEIAGYQQGIRADLGVLLDTLGNIYYNKRTWRGYRASVLLFSLAHRMVPDNTDYHNDWAWGLSKVGKRKEASREIEALMKLDSSNRKLLVERANLKLISVREDIKYLEDHAGVMGVSDFVSREAAIKTKLSDIRASANRICNTNSRCYSLIGMTCVASARMAVIAQDYYIGAEHDYKRARAKTVEALRYARDSIKFMSDAVSKASSKTEKDHATLVISGQQQALRRIFVSVWRNVYTRAFVYPDKRANLVSLLRGLLKETDAFFGGGPSGEQVKRVLDEFKIWADRTEIMYDRYMAIVKGCDEEDIADASKFLSQAASRMCEEPMLPAMNRGPSRVGVKNIANGIVAYVKRDLALTSIDLALIYVMQNLSDEDSFSPDTVKEYLQALGYEMSDTPDDQNRLNRIAGIMGISFVAQTVEKEEKRDKTRKIPSDMVDRLSLLQAIDENKRGGYSERLKHCRELYERISEWEEPLKLKAGYITGLRSELDSLSDKLVLLRDMVTVYTEQSKLKLSKEKREELYSLGQVASKTYHELSEGLPEIEMLISKRCARVESLINARCRILASKKEGYEAKYGKLEFIWMLDQENIIDNMLDEMTGVTVKGGENYLSYDTFEAAEETASNVCMDIDGFGSRLETFSEVIDGINALEEELLLWRAMPGAGSFIPALLSRVGEFREFIFSCVVDRKVTFDEMSDRETSRFLTITERTQILSYLRETYSMVKTVVHSGLIYSTSAEASFGDDKTGEIFGSVVNELLDVNVGSKNFWEQLVDINGNDSDVAVCTNMARRAVIKMMIIAECEAAISEGCYRSMLPRVRKIAELVPETSLLRDKIERNAADTEELLVSMRAISLASADFDARWRDISERLSYSNGDTSASLLCIKELSYAAGVREIIKFLDVIESWTKGWLIRPDDSSFVESMMTAIDSVRQMARNDFLESDNKDKFRKALGQIIKVLEDISYDKLNNCMVLVDKSLRNNLVDVLVESNMELAKLCQSGKKTQAMLSNVPKRRTLGFTRSSPDGKLVGLQFYIVDQDPNACEIFSMAFPYDAHGSSRLVDNINARCTELCAEVNSGCLSNEERFSGITLNPEVTSHVLANVISFIETFMVNSMDPDTALPDTFEIDRLLRTNVVDSITDMYRDYIDNDFSRDATVKLVKSKIDILMAKKERCGLDEEETVWLEDYRGFLQTLFHNRTVGWFVDETVQAAMVNVLKLVRTVYGTDFDIPERPVHVQAYARGLLLNETKQHFDASKVKYDHSYEGSYMVFDGCDFMCVVAEEAGANASVLSGVVRDSLHMTGYFLSRAVYGESDNPNAVIDLLARNFKGIPRNREIKVRIAEGLPVNSMIINGDIVIDKDFFEFIRAKKTEGAAPLVVLGERLYHELGLFGLYFEDPLPGLSGVVQHEAVQLVRDTLLYDKLFNGNPFLSAEVNSFARSKTVYPDGKTTTFQERFSTAGLFRKLRNWSLTIHEDSQKVREDIKRYADETVRKILGDTFPDEAGSSLRAGIDLAEKKVRYNDTDTEKMLLGSIMGIINGLDGAVLDSRAGKASGIISKRKIIAISKELIPASQEKLIPVINRESLKAVNAGRTDTLIQIRSCKELSVMRSDASTDVVLLLEKKEADMFENKEATLVFRRSGDSPVMINGLIAAGRACLFQEFGLLRDILKVLSANDHLSIPTEVELEAAYSGSREDFSRIIPVIDLPPVRSYMEVLEWFEGHMMKYLNYA